MIKVDATLNYPGLSAEEEERFRQHMEDYLHSLLASRACQYLINDMDGYSLGEAGHLS